MGVHSFVKSVSLLALAVRGGQTLRIIQSNDDGWAESNIRVFHNMLIQADHDAVISSPAENMSGKGKPFSVSLLCKQDQHRETKPRES